MESPDSPPPPKRQFPVSHDPVVSGVGFVMTELTRSVKPLARAEGETMVVEYGRPMKGFAIVGELIFLGLLVWSVATAEPEKRTTALVFWAVFLLMPVLLHLEFFHVSIRYNVHGLQTKSPWRRTRSIPWEDITGITFEDTAQWYVISTTRYGKVRVPFWLSGVESLLAQLEQRGFARPAARIKWKPS